MKLTIHKGADEIGGSCIEIATGSTRIILDLGWPLVDKSGEPFNIRSESRKGIHELVTTGVAPDVKGIYGDDEASVDAVLLSHSHLDHFGILSYINKSIPVFSSNGTKKIVELANFFGQSNYCPDGMSVIKPWEELQVGDISINPYLVDHSSCDAFCYLIEANGKRVFYSGDFRAHGRKGKVFENLIKNPPKDIDGVILEGTMLGRSEEARLTEQDVENQFVDLLSSKDGLCVTSFSSQNIDRFVSVFKACKRSGRVLVVDPYTACVLDNLRGVSPSLPQYDWEESFKIYFTRNLYTEKLASQNKLFKYKSAKITLDEIIENKSRLLIKDNFAFRELLSKQKLLDDATLIYSMWEGYRGSVEGFWTENSVPIEQVHCGGHAYTEDLQRLVFALKPKYVIPNHTFNPELYHELFETNVIEVGNGNVISIK